MADKQILLSQMAEAVVDMDEDLVEEAATEYVRNYFWIVSWNGRSWTFV